MMRVAMLLMVLASPAFAEGGGITIGGQPREYSYPADPQYQYPIKGERRRCPKGQALYQGRCRIKLPVR
jgi:hypothetical protein